MSEYPVNRGIGKPVEFKGLKSQYLYGHEIEMYTVEQGEKRDKRQ